jgi:hypothetical protein
MTPEIETRFQSFDNAEPFSLADYSGVLLPLQGHNRRLRRQSQEHWP